MCSTASVLDCISAISMVTSQCEKDPKVVHRGGFVNRNELIGNLNNKLNENLIQNSLGGDRYLSYSLIKLYYQAAKCLKN